MLVAAAVRTAEEPEIPRVNGDYLNKVELTRESPHMPFARPLAGGAVRAMFITPWSLASREVLELAERLDLDLVNCWDDCKK